ncbi:Uncharacterised protein [Kluyvera intermedia]|nr:Uncharacterised protein [Kluyvera intermedia]
MIVRAKKQSIKVNINGLLYINATTPSKKYTKKGRPGAANHVETNI